MNTARNIRVLLCAQGTYCRPGGIILIESTKIRWFSRWSGGGGWSLLSEAKSLKTTQKSSSGSSSLRLDGSRDGQAGGLTGYLAAAQGLYILQLSQEELSGSRPLRSDGSHDSQTWGWTICLVAKRCSSELENNSRQPRGITIKRQSDSLK